MAKKKETIVVNKEPLSTTVIGSITEKKGNLAFLLIIMVLLCLTLVLYPYLSPYIEKILNKETNTTSQVAEEEDVIEKVKEYKKITCDSKVEKIVYYNNESGIYLIKDTITVYVSDDNYLDNYVSNSETMDAYKDKEGYKTDVNIKDDRIIFNYEIDLSKADLTFAKSSYYVELNKKISDVEEMMKDTSFTCTKE